MKKTLLFFILAIAANTGLMAQQVSGKSLEELKGTYQVQIRGQLRESVSLPSNLADIISQKRDESRVIYYTIVENKVRVKILPKQYILSADYKPLGVQTIINEFTNE